ncbi:MAG: tetracycline destructase [Gammaproteobacteria bacterium]|nr:MAG: tetracycline destructase [Gammaproteobacteria bacterium]UTW42678.1 tetracycline destructase [bacterium SCSIO 12844]
MSHNHKILVIGAGIAGPAICYWLKKYGFNPTLIERSKQLRTGGYDIDIRGIAIDIVKKMDIYDSIRAKRTSLLSTRYVSADGQTLSEEYNEEGSFKEGDEVEIVRGDLVSILLEAIPDVPCYFDQEITSLIQKEQFVEVTFKNGHIEHYDLVMAADGLHSSTRKMTFSDEEYQFFNLGYYISVFSIPNYLDINRAQVIFTKDQKSISMNSDKDPDRAFTCVAFRSKKVLSGVTNEREQKECLRDLFYDMGWESNKIIDLMNDSDDFYFDVMAQIKMDSWTKGRIALLGDAGYCASPLSGMGINISLVGAYILAGELKSAEGDYAMAFSRYNKIMRPFVDANQNIAPWMGECFLTEDEVSTEVIEQRSSDILEKIRTAANAISLPDYV